MDASRDLARERAGRSASPAAAGRWGRRRRAARRDTTRARGPGAGSATLRWMWRGSRSRSRFTRPMCGTGTVHRRSSLRCRRGRRRWGNCGRAAAVRNRSRRPRRRSTALDRSLRSCPGPGKQGALPSLSPLGGGADIRPAVVVPASGEGRRADTGESGRSHANSCRFFLTGRFFGECRRHMPLRPAGRTRTRRVCVHYRYMWITSDTIYLMETSRNLPGGKAPGASVRVRFREMIRPFRTGGNGEGSRNSGQDHGITPGDTESVLFPLSVGSS